MPIVVVTRSRSMLVVGVVVVIVTPGSINSDGVQFLNDLGNCISQASDNHRKAQVRSFVQAPVNSSPMIHCCRYSMRNIFAQTSSDAAFQSFQDFPVLLRYS